MSAVDVAWVGCGLDLAHQPEDQYPDLFLAPYQPGEELRNACAHLTAHRGPDVTLVALLLFHSNRICDL